MVDARTSLLASVGLGTLMMEGVKGKSSVRRVDRMVEVLMPGWKGTLKVVRSGRTVCVFFFVCAKS